MMRATIALPLLLVACATARPIPIEQEIHYTSTQVLCFAETMADIDAPRAALAAAENRRRGHVCSKQDVDDGRTYFARMLEERQQMQRQREASTSRFFEALLFGAAIAEANRPPPPLPPVTCQTHYFGNNATTTCR